MLHATLLFWVLSCPEHGTSVIIMMHAIYVNMLSMSIVDVRRIFGCPWLCEHMTLKNLNIVGDMEYDGFA